MGSKSGIEKVAAGRRGMTVEAYRAKLAAGFKWCTACKAWRGRAEFNRDRHRGDGLAQRCRKHRTNAPPEPLEKRRARRRVHMRVRRGTLPHPSTIACRDCGGPAAEYDHPRGYDGEAAVDVEAVCTSCHADRGVRRGEFRHG